MRDRRFLSGRRQAVTLEQFLYLCLGGVVCAATGIVALFRRDLWPAMWPAGLIGGGIEVVAEVWYLQDYWSPDTLLPIPSPEDFLYGFGVTALAVAAVPFWCNRHYSPILRPNAAYGKWIPSIALSFIVLMGIGVGLTPFPSIWVASIVFAAGGTLACLVRRDLWPWALLAGAIMGMVAVIGYGIGLNWLIDGKNFLADIYLLHGTRWDIRILGQVPLDEIVWNITRGFCVAALYPFATGCKLARRSF